MPSVTFEKQSVTFFAQSVTVWLTVLHWRPKHAKCYFWQMSSVTFQVLQWTLYLLLRSRGFRLETVSFHIWIWAVDIESMGMALKGMWCVNKPPPQGLADTGNRRDIVSNNCVTCLYCHLQSTHMSFLVGHHTPSKCVHSHTHREPGNNFSWTCLQSRPTPRCIPPHTIS